MMGGHCKFCSGNYWRSAEEPKDACDRCRDVQPLLRDLETPCCYCEARGYDDRELECPKCEKCNGRGRNLTETGKQLLEFFARYFTLEKQP